MSPRQASERREALWAELKPLLIRGLGKEGAAEWLAFAADQMALDAKRDAFVAAEMEALP